MTHLEFVPLDSQKSVYLACEGGCSQGRPRAKPHDFFGVRGSAANGYFDLLYMCRDCNHVRVWGYEAAQELGEFFARLS